MEISDFIRIKRNVDDIIENELTGHPKNEVIEYIEILERELIKKDVEVERPEIELDLEDHDQESPYYIGTLWTRKDLENECNEYFDKWNKDFDLDTLDPDEYHEQMLKAYNRMSVRKSMRLKKLKKQNQLF
tara:strand:- start:1372 stop:1764 length:393 start_codon:yes stop_codon:yes gene_type:complete